ncbi:DNA-directed RNA polymerase subunit K [Candidatus Bathyarchaeota archaeon]|nr:DNA-directed RNA polymerase subunit K [Candidatus Bathyarchaeota archaeon]
MIILTSVFIGPPKMSRFEKARIVGARALQIAMGAPILTEVTSSSTNSSSSSIEIALKELREKVLPITVRRRLPDGTFQNIPIQWLELA